MRCPFCASSETHVLETRDAGDSVRRRRACAKCERRFTTYERIESLALAVRKRDGGREAFDRDKLLRGLVRAAAKRPLTVDQLEQVVEHVARVLGAAGGELPANRIGELVLHELRALDEVAYVRFASVYRNFENAGQFAAELEGLEGRRVSDGNPTAERPAGARTQARNRGSVRAAGDDPELPQNTPGPAAKVLENAAEGEELVHGA